MSSLTTHYSLVKPGVGDPVDQDIWGSELNQDLDSIDTLLFNNVNSPTINGNIAIVGTLNETAPVTIASTATLDVSAATIASNNVTVTGTTNISVITLGIGATRRLTFTGALNLVNSASLLLPSRANITTASGDWLEVIGTSAGVEVFNYQRSNGQPVLGVFSKAYNSGNQTMSQAGLLTLAHGLGVQPTLIQCRIVCLVSEGNYSVGDELIANPNVETGGGGTNTIRGQTVKIDTTNITVRFANNATNNMGIANSANGNLQYITWGNWAFKVLAWA